MHPTSNLVKHFVINLNPFRIGGGFCGLVCLFLIHKHDALELSE